MGTLDLVQLGVTLFFSFAAWLLPDSPWYIKVIITGTVFLISLLIYYAKLDSRRRSLERKHDELKEKNDELLLQIEALKKSLDESEKNHSAISRQFDQKVGQKAQYDRAFQKLEYIFHLAMLHTDSAKIVELYRLFLSIQNDVKNGEN